MQDAAKKAVDKTTPTKPGRCLRGSSRARFRHLQPPAGEPAAAATPDGPTDLIVRMAKFSVSVDVPLPPEKAWECASDLSRYKEWLSIHRVWRSKLPETLEKGTVLDSIVEVKGMPNRMQWTVVHYKPPEAMTLNGDGKGGVKVKLIGKVKPSR